MKTGPRLLVTLYDQLFFVHTFMPINILAITWTSSEGQVDGIQAVTKTLVGKSVSKKQ